MFPKHTGPPNSLCHMNSGRCISINLVFIDVSSINMLLHVHLLHMLHCLGLNNEESDLQLVKYSQMLGTWPDTIMGSRVLHFHHALSPPKTQCPSTYPPVILLPNLLSSILTLIPKPLITAGWSIQYCAQTSHIKSYQSTVVALPI